jgi:hypothetical protein
MVIISPCMHGSPWPIRSGISAGAMSCPTSTAKTSLSKDDRLNSRNLDILLRPRLCAHRGACSVQQSLMNPSSQPPGGDSDRDYQPNYLQQRLGKNVEQIRIKDFTSLGRATLFEGLDDLLMSTSTGSGFSIRALDDDTYAAFASTLR